jgi:hypothetical protein
MGEGEAGGLIAGFTVAVAVAVFVAVAVGFGFAAETV